MIGIEMCASAKLAVVFVLIGLHGHSSEKVPKEELDPEYLRQEGQRELLEAIQRKVNMNVARNVILFVGDGMGLSTVTAARILRGQRDGKPGEETKLTFEKFPNIALAKTYNVDHQVPDSAGTATAYLCGVKSNYGTIGLDPRASRGRCRHSQGRNLTCIAQLAQEAGKSTGFVVTSKVTHASPAPLYAVSPDRSWENDALVPRHARQHGCKDIGAQLADPVGNKIDVVLGGGRGNLMPDSERDPEHGELGRRQDGRNIIKEWLGWKESRGETAQYVWNKRDFYAVDPKQTENLIGLFENGNMRYDAERVNDTAGEPSLAEMVDKAIRILSRNKNGFFLFVEGSRIDHGHHYNSAAKALEETIALDAAVERALELVNLDDTLVIVTADHSHPLSISSYASRGNPILGLTDNGNDEHTSRVSDVDNLPYTTLSYATGPGYQGSPRKDLSRVNTASRTYMQATTVPLRIVAHDATDVPIYATGAMAHLFHTTHEQHYIFHAITYAACLGTKDVYHCYTQSHPGYHQVDGKERRAGDGCGYSGCAAPLKQNTRDSSSSSSQLQSLQFILTLFLAVFSTFIHHLVRH